MGISRRSFTTEAMTLMRYGITLRTFGSRPFLAISADEFVAIKTAHQNLLLVLSIEEKFDALLQNYVEYERELLVLALDHTVFRKFEWSTYVGDRQTVIRRLANMLTLARVYIDHTKHELNTIYGKKSEISAQLVKAFRAAHDKSLGYRVMEALRNHIQHRAFPIGTLNYTHEWEDRATPLAAMRARIVPLLDLQGLRDDSKFNKPVLRDLEREKNAAHDITLFVREYIENLSHVHEALRSTCREVETWQQTITAALARYRAFSGGRALGTVAVREDDAGGWLETVTIFAEPIRRLEYLRKKNVCLVNLSRRYVSNETG